MSQGTSRQDSNSTRKGPSTDDAIKQESVSMRGSKTGSMIRMALIASLFVAVVGFGLPAQAGSISVKDAYIVFGPGWVDQTEYVAANGVYSLAKGEQLVSITVSWEWESYNSVTGKQETWIVTDTYYSQNLPSPGLWASASGMWWPPEQEWVNQFQVTLNYKDATGKLRSVSTPWVYE